MAAPAEELHDIADPAPLLPGIAIPWWAWLIAAAIIVILLGSVAFLFLRRKETAPTPRTSNYEESRSKLAALRGALEGKPLAEVATASSLVIRGYLAAALDEPALYETHEEFIMRADALEHLSAGARDRLAPLLDELAACKYGPSSENPEAAATLVDNCLNVLQGLESTRDRLVA